MNYPVVCHGARLFGLVLPPFALAEGGLVIAKTHTVTRESQLAELLLCEALCGMVVVEGIEVPQPFVAVHPYLRAHAWGCEVAEEVFHPRDKVSFLIEHGIKYIKYNKNIYNIIPELENCLRRGVNIVFSFRALGGEGRLQVRDLVMARHTHVAAFGIEGLTTNFSVEEFMPDATIITLT